MATTPNDPIVVLGGGPAGMAAALALHTVGQPVVILERYREARPAGNILNLWPPPLKALREIGVDTTDIGAPNHTTFQNARGHIRADVRIPQHVLDEYGGGFIGLLRPDLYRRMLAALPEGMLRTGQEVLGIEDRGADVLLTLRSGETVRTPLLVGADGIDSIVRTHLWGASPKRDHKLHIIGGYTFASVPEAVWGELPLIHTSTVRAPTRRSGARAGTGTSGGCSRPGIPRRRPPRTCSSTPGGSPPRSRGAARARRRDRAGARAALADPRPRAPEAVVEGPHHPRRGRRPRHVALRRLRRRDVDQRRVLPRPARSRGVDLADTAAVVAALQAYETPRIPHTTAQVQQAYVLGRVFHHAPAPLRPLRDYVLDHTPFLQKQVGERSPGEIIDQLAEMGQDIRTPA